MIKIDCNEIVKELDNLTEEERNARFMKTMDELDTFKQQIQDSAMTIINSMSESGKKVAEGVSHLVDQMMSDITQMQKAFMDAFNDNNHNKPLMA